MRKALIGLLITATAVTPLASAAAQSRSSRDEQRVERAERQVQRAQRQERRADRTERRTDRRVEQAVRQGNDRQVDRAVRQERRADRVEQRTDSRLNRAEQRLDRAERQQQTRNWGGNRDSNWADRYRNRDQRATNDRDRSWSRDRGSNHSWNHDWRNDRRYDWRRYRNSHRHIYNAGRYYSPYRHHRYSRFSIGFFLEPLFFSQRYWISDPWHYRLPPAYPGTRWVRYYDDVLLIDMYSGEVIDVIYDFFW
jgi:hypothetical protein